MAVSETLIAALRTLSSVPQLRPDELTDFSRSVDEDCPLPDASFGTHPVWRIPTGSPPPAYFSNLIAALTPGAGLVARDGYLAVGLIDVVLVAPDAALREMIDEGVPHPLTGAEFRLAVQMLQGTDLKQAAAEDNTSHETKRSQFKSLAAKLGLRSQSEVVRVLTTRVMQGFAQLAQPSDQSELARYADIYLPPAVRRLSIVTPTGESVRMLDYGPITGRPLVVLHPMFFPPIGPEEIAQAEELGVRLIWPLRPGLLDSQAKVRSAKDHLAVSVDGLVAVLQQVVGQPAPILAFVSSGAVAVRAAAAVPDYVSSISFVATCYSAGRSTVSIPYVGAELIELAFRSEAIMTRTVAGLRKYVAADKRFRQMFEHTMRASTRDVSHLKAEFDGPDKGERLRMVTLQSPESIKHDFFNQTQFSWAELTALTTPRQFLQGADDSIHPPHKLAAILERHGEAPLTTSEVMGHLPHFSDLRRSIRFALSEPGGTPHASDLPA